MPKTFEIEIENIKFTTAKIEAENIEEAINIAIEKFNKGEILLDEVNCDESKNYIRGVYDYVKDKEEPWNENYEWEEL